jgi:hypothetical protein
VEVDRWKKLERHPLSAEYADIQGEEFERFVAELKKWGNVNNARKVMLVKEGEKFLVLDGWQYQRASVTIDRPPDYVKAPKTSNGQPIALEEIVRVLNDNRRHESAEEIRIRRQAKVARLRAEGESIRTIAEKVGASPATVQRDLEDLPVSSDTGSTNGTGEHPPEPAKPARVKGKDGNTYPADRPTVFCDKCSRLIADDHPAVEGCNDCKAARKSAKDAAVKRRKRAKEKAEREAREKAEREGKAKTLDNHGVEIPQKRLDAWFDPWLRDTTERLAVLLDNLLQQKIADGVRKRDKTHPFLDHKEIIQGLGQAQDALDKIIKHLKEKSWDGVCPLCDGKGCDGCHGKGLVPAAQWKEFTKERKELDAEAKRKAKQEA